MTALDIDGTIAALERGDLEAVLHHAPKGVRLPGPERQVPLEAGHINTLTRACLTAPPGFALAVADFSQVEARALAWAAEDHDALARFRAYDAGDKVNGDPYRTMAARIFGGTPADWSKESKERQIGKAAELACGYGQGGGGPESPYHGKDFGKPFGFYGYVVKNGGSWDEIIQTMGLTCGASEAAKVIVSAWRELHYPIVCFWKELQDACLEAARGGTAQAGPFTFADVDGLVVCELPSGRVIAYYGLSVKPGNKKAEDFRDRQPRLSYWGKRGREHLYGGKLAENAIQAMCRDLMAVALVEAERAGLRPVHTIHDEILCEVPEAEAEAARGLLVEIMHAVPAWARGMPIAAEGLPVGKRYGK